MSAGISWRLAANLSTMFSAAPFTERARLAREAGFRAVEIQYPYKIAATDLRKQLSDEGLELVLMNAPAGVADERGLACIGGRKSDFQEAALRAFDYAVEVKCPAVHILCGRVGEPEDSQSLFERAADRYAWAVERAVRAGLKVVIEALNQQDVPGYLLKGVPDAARLIRMVEQRLDHRNRPGLLFDVFHAARNGEPIVAQLREYQELIAHIQIADQPGRGALGTGRTDWKSFFSVLKQLNYTGWIGCEYTDSGSGAVFEFLDSAALIKS